MKKFPYLVLMTALSLYGGLSCSKGSGGSGNSNNNCQLTEATEDGQVLSITYNNNGDVSTAQDQQGGSTNWTNILTYSGSTVYSVDSYSSYTVYDTATVNASGYMTAFSTQTDVTGQSTQAPLQSYTYSYAAPGQPSQIIAQQAGSQPVISVVVFTNGNVTSITSPGDTAVYTYYTDKPYQPGDYIWIFQTFNYPAYFIKNANLVASASEQGTVLNFSYRFDASGKIVSITETSGSTVDSVQFDYTCN